MLSEIALDSCSHTTLDRSRAQDTDLTDDELILLDVLFDGGTSFPQVRREVFEQQWNGRSQNLSDGDLVDVLGKLINCGYLKIDEDSGVEYFELTPNGRAAWERERLPVWVLFGT